MKPIFALVTAPLLLLTLGLFLIVINACMLLLTSWVADKVDLGWHVDGFWVAVSGAIIVSIVSFVLNAFLPDAGRSERRGRARTAPDPGRLRLLGQHLPLPDRRAGGGARRRRRPA